MTTTSFKVPKWNEYFMFMFHKTHNLLATLIKSNSWWWNTEEKYLFFISFTADSMINRKKNRHGTRQTWQTTLWLWILWRSNSSTPLDWFHAFYNLDLLIWESRLVSLLLGIWNTFIYSTWWWLSEVLRTSKLKIIDDLHSAMAKLSNSTSRFPRTT